MTTTRWTEPGRVGPVRGETPRLCRINPATAFLPAAAAVLLLAVSGCGDEQAAGGPPAQERLSLVLVAEVQSENVAPKVVAVGNVTPSRTSSVESGANGVVQFFHVDEGQYVEEGQVLSELRMESTDLEIAEAVAVLNERQQMLEELEAGSRPEDIEEARANMQAAEVVRRNAEIDLGRARRLSSQGVINQDRLDQATEAFDAAVKELEAAQAVLDRVEAGPRQEQIAQAQARRDAQAAQVEFLKAEREKRTTRAPFSGYVVSEDTEVGQWLAQGDPVVQLTQLDEVDVIAQVDQWDLKHIRLGAQAQVLVKGSTKTEWEGEIVQIVPRSEWQTGSRGFPVKVRVANEFYTEGGRQLARLKEGMMAEVAFTGTEVEAVMIPKDALVRTTGGIDVFVFEPSKDDPQTGVARKVRVETGLSEGETIEVVAEGIAPGMQVIVEGAERLQNFQQVQIAPPRDRETADR
ncbi:MAG: efflux RND transporter periplasmic adaptor subunit [Planctomycetaceae bacterium]